MFSLLVSMLIIFIDQTNKYMAYTYLKNSRAINLAGGIIRIVYSENKGAAFGILENKKYFFIIVTLVIISIISIWNCVNKSKSILFNTSLALIIGGGIGNLIDRLLLGYVIDYIKISFFDPVCNISDYAIFFGAVLWVVYMTFMQEKITDIKKYKEYDK